MQQQLIIILYLMLSTFSLFSQEAELVTTNEGGGFQYLEQKRVPVLDYPYVDERDILWQKKIWRVLDTREKINLPFRYPEAPLFTIIMEEIKDGNIVPYSTEDDKFTNPMNWAEIQNLISTQDTVITFDPETYEEQIQVVTNDLNPDDIKKYRMKEIWYFDTKYSTLKVRILGIAPIISVFDDQGNFRYEKPLFWIYYPKARYHLANYLVFNEDNTASPMTWEDRLEMRFFSSYIIKESNVYDRRLSDYLAGPELLQNSEKIKETIFNYEMDLWSY